MAKSRSHRSKGALPALGRGLKNVGKGAKYVAVKSAPVVEKGVSAIYGTIAKGVNLGFKGLAKGLKSRRRSKKRGGRKTRRH